MLCTRLLAGMGARVIRVEKPGVRSVGVVDIKLDRND